MRVTHDALAVETPVWMLGHSAYDILDCHDHPLVAGVVPITLYTPRDTNEPLDIEFRVEARTEEHGKDVQYKQSILDETYNCRTGVERTNAAVKDCRLGSGRARSRVHTHEQKYSLRCVCGSLLQPPTSGGEMIRAVRSSSYDMDSMTRSKAQ